MHTFGRKDILHNSVIVAAHPDDEILWFSSILSKVDQLIICFLEVASRPEWSKGRRKSLSHFPLSGMQCLNLKEGEVFWGADWEHPQTTDYGLRITEYKLSDLHYRNNFDLLKKELLNRLSGYQNVFTHNPWGEYGHIEHVQVYRAVKAVQNELGFNLWFTSYLSNKSMKLMADEYSKIGSTTLTLDTDRELAASIAALYKENNCWTWYDDYEWWEQESFIQDSASSDGENKMGTLFPMQFIDVGISKPPFQLSAFQKMKQRIKRKMYNFSLQMIHSL